MANLSLHAIDQMYQQESSDPILMLLKIDFPNGNSFYYVNNTQNITSNGQEYSAFPFQFNLPNDEVDSVPELSITLDNIGLELINDFSQNTDSINCEINLVFASNPDYSELKISNLVVKNISYDKSFININLGYDDILNLQVPSDTYNPIDFPGIFNV